MITQPYTNINVIITFLLAKDELFSHFFCAWLTVLLMRLRNGHECEQLVQLPSINPYMAIHARYW